MVLTIAACLAAVTAFIVGLHRALSQSRTASAAFDRSMKLSTDSEFRAESPVWMPPTFPMWNQLWQAAGRAATDDPRAPGLIAVTVGIVGVVFGVAVFPGGAVGATVGVAAVAAMWGALTASAHKRVTVMEKQLPLLLSGMRAQLTAGVPPQTALIDTAPSIPEPLGVEINQVRSALATGVPLTIALARFSERVPTRQVKFFVASMDIAVASGADLHPQLLVIEDIYEQRARISGKIRAALALVKPTAWMAQVAPLIALAWSLSSDPNAFAYFTGKGLGAFLAGCGLYAAGIVTIHVMMRQLTRAVK